MKANYYNMLLPSGCVSFKNSSDTPQFIWSAIIEANNINPIKPNNLLWSHNWLKFTAPIAIFKASPCNFCVIIKLRKADAWVRGSNFQTSTAAPQVENIWNGYHTQIKTELGNSQTSLQEAHNRPKITGLKTFKTLSVFCVLVVLSLFNDQCWAAPRRAAQWWGFSGTAHAHTEHLVAGNPKPLGATLKWDALGTFVRLPIAHPLFSGRALISLLGK